MRSKAQPVALLGLRQRLLRPTALGNVDEDGDEVARRAGPVAQRHAHHLRPDGVPVAVAVAALALVQVGGHVEPLFRGADAVARVVGVGEVHQAAALQLGAVEAEHSDQRGVDAEEAAVGRQQGHADAAVLEDQAEMVLRLAESALGAVQQIALARGGGADQPRGQQRQSDRLDGPGGGQRLRERGAQPGGGVDGGTGQLPQGGHGQPQGEPPRRRVAAPVADEPDRAGAVDGRQGAGRHRGRRRVGAGR